MAVVVFLSSMAVVLFVAHWSMLNWRVWQYKMNGKVWSFTARCVSIGESDVRVNFGGVTFFSGDHLYADNTGIILSEDPLDIE